MKAGVVILTVVVSGVVSPAGATWDLSFHGGKIAEADGTALPPAPEGSIAVLTGTLTDGDTFRASCAEQGVVAFSYIQPGKWLPVLAQVDFSLTLYADGEYPVKIDTRPRKLADNLVAYENDGDQAAVRAVLQTFVDAIHTIELDVVATGYGVSWRNAASAKDSTVTTQRFAAACGVELLPFGRRRSSTGGSG